MIEVLPDISAIFYAIVESRGGESCFDEAQLELTLALARMTADVRGADPASLVKLMDVIQKSADSFLPPRKPQPRQSRQPPITKHTSLSRAAQIYSAALADEDMGFYEDEVAVDNRQTIDLRAEPAVAAAPEPAQPQPETTAAPPVPEPVARESSGPVPSSRPEPPPSPELPMSRPQPALPAQQRAPLTLATLRFGR
jgi:hypothetical protein